MASPCSLAGVVFPSVVKPSTRLRPQSLRPRLSIKALKQWKDYEDAVKDKDLDRALRFLKSTQLDSLPVETPELPEAVRFRDLSRPERDWEVLDTCLNADDMRLVGRAYDFLQDRGLLPNFGKFRNIILEGPRDVTPTILRDSTGLEASAFAPKKWGMSGGSRNFLIGFVAGVSFLISQGIDVRPNLAAILALGALDATFLGGSCLAQIMCFWPPYKRRIVVHEAGHLLIAYLLGCPIRGVILDPIVAMQMDIRGQAGTQFWDQKLNDELAEGRLSSTAFDRYCMVLFAGVAAEALVYGDAEGGENDENLFRSICSQLRPPLTVAQMSNQARWSILQSYNLLKWHKNAHKAAVKALDSGHSLSVVIRRIEEAMSSSN